MGFHSLLKESLLRTGLRRIRIKTDPAEVSGSIDFAKIAGYEGFILSECMGKLKVLVLDPALTLAGDISEDMLDALVHESDIDVMDEFKQHAKTCLIRCKNKQDNDPLLGQIDNAATLSDIESFIKQGGVTESELNEMYRSFIEND